MSSWSSSGVSRSALGNTHFYDLASVSRRDQQIPHSDQVVCRRGQREVPTQAPDREIGYIPIDRHGANLFFQLISRRYEKGAMILTSNQPYFSWGEVFGDRIIATAIIDRVLHHAITINIKGESYRLKEKLKAGLLQRQEPKE